MARDVVMVNGLPGSGKSSLAPRLAMELGAACLGKDRIKEALADAVVIGIPRLGAVAMETLWSLSAEVSGMVVVDSWWFRPRDLEQARAGQGRRAARPGSGDPPRHHRDGRPPHPGRPGAGRTVDDLSRRLGQPVRFGEAAAARIS